MHPLHLARRFFASVFARSPGPGDQDWVAGVLDTGELELWRQQPRYDRSHSVGVARRVDAALAADSEPRWLAAALLHDVGKVRCGLGVMGRVVGTLLMAGLGRARVRSWAGRSGWRARFGRYATHGELGAEMIRARGGREVVARWAELHHQPGQADPDGLGELPRTVARVLKASDRD